MLYAALHLTVVQNWLIQIVAGKLSKDLNTVVKIEHIDLHFFNRLEIKGLLVEDRSKDTLLYAGTAKVKITDWFFVKDKAVLEYASLQDAVVNMRRTKDSVWNYQFIADYFSSPEKKKKSSGGIELDLKEVQLANIRFNKIDGWKGENMLVSLKKLELLADTMDFKSRKIHIRSLLLDEPIFSLTDYMGERDRLNLPVPQSQPDTTVHAYQWNEDGWVAQVKQLQLHNGTFNSNDETTLPPDGQFDGSHIRFGHINADMQNIHFEKDTLRMNLQLATKERSGFEVKQLSALFKFTPEVMEFRNMDIITNKSHLRNYYAMHYKDFGEDMSRFLHNVKLDASFADSEINSDDIAFFAPELKTWKRVFNISGQAHGSIDNLVAKNMDLRSGPSSLKGNLVLRGLPDMDNTFIDISANDLNTTYADLASFITELKQVDMPALSKLGNISYRGNYTGFINDFVAYGTIGTALGTITGDINLKLPAGRPAVYLGKIATSKFNLGTFLKMPQLGDISFSGKINGSGFSASTVNAHFDGHINVVDVAGYNYRDINLNGNFIKRLFSGTASVNDPNLKLSSIAGSVDFSEKQPGFRLDAALDYANLKPLQLTQDAFKLGGNFSLAFNGNTIDNFLGTARVTNAILEHEGVPLSFDSLVLQSQVRDGKKYLSVQSNELDATLAGKFTIFELPDAFNVFLSRYIPAYIKRPSYTVSEQDFTFDITTREIDQFISLADKKLKGFNYSHISGRLNLKENELDVHADVPEFSYDGKLFTNTKLESSGTLDSLTAKIEVEDIMLNDSLHLPSSTLQLSAHNDTSYVSIKTSASKTLNDASVNARLVTLTDGVKVHFYPSSFIINDRKWQLEKDGELAFTKAQMSASDVKFVQGTQEISISTQPSSEGHGNDIHVSLTKVNADDFLPYFIKQPRLEGLATGEVIIEDPFAKPFIKADVDVAEFKTDGDSIGLVKLSGSMNTATGIIDVRAVSDNPDNNFEIGGKISLKDSTANQVALAIKSQRLNLSILNPYLAGIVSDIKGIANTSGLAIEGKASDLALTGVANIEEASMKVDYTQCVYSFKNKSIIFNKDEIDFGRITLKDIYNNTGTLSGKIGHRFFKDFQFDNLAFETKRMLLLNTTKKDNSQFYGRVIGNATMSLNGPVENMRMDIEGAPSTTDSSQIYILSGSSVESGVIDYIDFVQFGTEMKKIKTGASTNIVLNMVLHPNPACKIDVVLDETTGDVIKGVGSGLLKIRVGNREPLTINGVYNIEKGDYTFNFQTVLKKYFTVSDGSIVWSGDPFKAKIDITAEYLAEKVDFSNLNYSSGSNITTGQQQSDLKVVAHLTETLLKPNIDFELQLPPGSPITDFFIIKRLEQFKQDKNELNKQVTSLLLFNSFISTSQGILQSGAGISALSNTIGGIVSSVVSGFFNSFLQKYVKNLRFNLGASTTVSGSSKDLQADVARIQAAAKSNFVYTLLNGRLIITAGVNLDYNNPYVATGRNSNVLLTPDITAEWILSKDGKFRIVGFNRTNFDLTGQRNRTGASISYRRDFEQISKAVALLLFGETPANK